MRRLAVAACLVVLAGCSGGGDGDPEAVATQQRALTRTVSGEIPAIVERVQPSVVSVLVSGGQGSGVVYDSDGLVVTNAHVVRDATAARGSTRASARPTS